MNHHRDLLKARVALNQAGEGKAVHLRHLQVGKHHRDFIADGHPFGVRLLAEQLDALPGILPGNVHGIGDLHRLQPLIQHRARHFRIFGDNRHRARLNIEGFIGDVFTVQIVIGRHDVIQDLLNVQHHRQVIAVTIVIQAGNTGNVVAVNRFFGGVDLLPVQANDVFHRLDGKRLHAAGILRDQQNIQAGCRLAARDRREIDNRDHLVSNIDHPHQRRLHSRRAGKSRHGHNFAQFKHVDAEQL